MCFVSDVSKKSLLFYESKKKPITMTFQPITVQPPSKFLCGIRSSFGLASLSLYQSERKVKTLTVYSIGQQAKKTKGFFPKIRRSNRFEKIVFFISPPSAWRHHCISSALRTSRPAGRQVACSQKMSGCVSIYF